MLENVEIWGEAAEEETSDRFAFPFDTSSHRVFRAKVAIPPCNRRKTAQCNFSKLTSKVIDAAIGVWYATHT